MKASILGILALVSGGYFVTPAFADGGHGGTAVVCRNPLGQILQAEVLDLYEARVLYGIQFIGVFDIALARSSLLFDLRTRYLTKSLYPSYLESMVNDFHPRFRLLAPNLRINLKPDIFPKISGVGCAIEQLADAQDDGAIWLDSQIFNALSPLSRLALELHESVDALDRKWTKSTDSVHSRRMVGELLSRTWGAPLDALIQAYAFGVPTAGVYVSDKGEGTCEVSIQIGMNGAIRVSPRASSFCNSFFPPEPFLETGFADFHPNGTSNEWELTSGLRLELHSATEIQLGTGVLTWTHSFN